MEGGQEGLLRREDPGAGTLKCELKKLMLIIPKTCNSDMPHPLHILIYVIPTTILSSPFSDGDIKA